MGKRRLILVLVIIFASAATVVLFGNYALMRLNTELYVKLSLFRTYNNIKRNNTKLVDAFFELSGKTLRVESIAETVDTNIRISGIKIKNVSLNTSLLWDRKDTFFAENSVKLGVFKLADINLFLDESIIAVSVPKVIDEYVVFDKAKLIGEPLKQKDKMLDEIVNQTAELFSKCSFTYVGVEEKSLADVTKKLNKIKVVLEKKDIELYVSRLNELFNISDIQVDENITIHIYTNKKHEVSGFELVSNKGVPTDIELKFLLFGEKWILSDFAYELDIFYGKRLYSQGIGSVRLYEKDKIELILEPVRIITDFYKADMEIDARMKVALSEADTDEITFNQSKSLKYEDLPQNKIYEMLNWYNKIMKYLE